ncbi:MAG: type I glyceraldehyde-3-phosphate dehydrogenase [Coriobacteriia bacterium]|nr:type I glyceraldehyde-3-phosphate dehydrogenase [Coriobacteriia bacterium]
MAIKAGVSGLGRIGRLTLHAMMNNPEFEVIAINDLTKIDAIAHLLKYDSVHGRMYQTVEKRDDGVVLDGTFVKGLYSRDVSQLNWGELGVDIVVEASGKLNDGTSAGGHIVSGAKKVILTAPGKDIDATLIMGVNEKTYIPELHHIVSNSSCTTNCLAPLAKVLQDEFGIVRGYMNTIHAYTSDQNILDGTHNDLRRARAAALSLIPTTTGAASSLSLVLPELEGKLDGFATRVPTPDASMIDLTVELGKDVSVEEVNAAIRRAAEGAMAGIIEYCEDPIVSVDVIGNLHSCVFDANLTMVLGDSNSLVKCVAWYDNEKAYAHRVMDLASYMMTA